MQRRWIRLALLWLVAVVYAAGLFMPAASAHAAEMPAYACLVAVDAGDEPSPPPLHNVDRCQHQCASCTLLPAASTILPPVANVKSTWAAMRRLDGLTIAPELLPPIA